MPESTTTTGDPQLTDADVDAALRRTLERGDGLLRRRRARTAAFGGLAVVVLLAAGFGILDSLSDDRPVVITPSGNGGGTTAAATAASTSTSVVPEVQPGYELQVEGSVYLLTRTDADGVTTSVGDDVAIGGGVAVERNVAVVDHEVVDDSHVIVRFACSGTAMSDVDEARYRIDGSTITVAAMVSTGGAGYRCQGERGGAAVVLSFPDGGVPAVVTVEAGEV